MIDFHIMTVPERIGMALALQAQIPGSRVWNDKEHKGPWFNWRRAAESSQSEYVCIVQDDVVLCSDFVAGVERLLTPYSPVSLFSSRPTSRPRLRVEVGLPSAQGVLMHRKLAAEAIAFADAHHDPRWKYDDCRLSAWSLRTECPFIFPEPCLLDHRQDVVSAVGGSGATRARGRSFTGLAHDFGEIF